MRLVSITVENYRSITKAYKIRLGNLTTLVGPNNEGKSNILRSLVTAMRVLTEERQLPQYVGLGGRHRLRFSLRGEYDWERDFPVHLQAGKPNGESIIVLEFELTDTEIDEFRQVIGSTLNGTLPLRISLGHRGDYSIIVAKQGPGSKALSEKSTSIAAFIGDRLDFQHIPAVRTASSSEEVVRGMVERELRPLEKDPEYLQALQKIADLQQPVLAQLSINIKDTLVGFLPAVKDVKLQIRADDRTRALRRSVEIIVDDGSPTLLQYKGDGVQSLAALGFMRHASERSAKGKGLVIAIEEPESHLHPSAIHDLHRVITELSEKHQIVLTTHCPLFVDRINPSSNIIVLDQKARPAKNIEEVRGILGVRASDNLRHAEVVLLVEGEDDRTALTGLLSSTSPFLTKSLRHGSLAIDSMAGASNLAYKAGLVRDALCSIYVFLDNDDASRRAFEHARSEGLLSDAEITYAIVPGLKDSELEDMYNPDSYSQLILDTYGVSLDSPKFKGNSKWSDRMAAVFLSQGKQWNDRVEQDVKLAVAAAAADSNATFLHPARRSSLDALITALAQRLKPGKSNSGF